MGCARDYSGAGVALFPVDDPCDVLQYHESPPPCYGIGWGCSLDPGTSGAVSAFFWFFALGWVALAMALTELFWQRVALVRSILALVVLLAAVAAVLLVSAAAALAALT